MTSLLLVAGSAVAGFCISWLVLRATQEAGDVGWLREWWWQRQCRRAQGLVEQAWEARISGAHSLAVRLAQRALDLDEGDPRCMLEVGLSLLEVGELPAARACLESTCRRLLHGSTGSGCHVEELEAEARYALATIHATLSQAGPELDREQHVEAALTYLEQAIRLDQETVDTASHEPAFASLATRVQLLLNRATCSQEWMQP